MPRREITDSDWADLHGRVSTLETAMQYIGNSQTQLIEQIGEITVSQRNADAHRREQTVRMDNISAELATNSATTREILEATRDLRDVVITARTGGKFAKWLAPTLLSLAAAAAVIKTWLAGANDWLNR